jgi:hypothetical protein
VEEAPRQLAAYLHARAQQPHVSIKAKEEGNGWNGDTQSSLAPGTWPVASWGPS